MVWRRKKRRRGGDGRRKRAGRQRKFDDQSLSHVHLNPRRAGRVPQHQPLVIDKSRAGLFRTAAR